MWHASRLVLVQLAGVSVVVGCMMIVNQHLPVADWIASMPVRTRDWGVMGAVLYPIVFALCNLLLLPGGVLGLGAGYCFGLWWGFALSRFGTLVGAAIAFLVSRRWARGLIERLVLKDPRWLALDKAIDREGWGIVILSQMNPLFPTSLFNYIYGVTKIGFWKCMAGVAIGQAPGLLLYAYLGTLGHFGVKMLRGGDEPQVLEYWLTIGGLVMSVVLTFMLGLIAARIWREHCTEFAGPAAKIDDDDVGGSRAVRCSLPEPAEQALPRTVERSV